MAPRRATTIYLYELAGILPSIALPVGMLAALAVTAFGAGIHLPTHEGRVVPTKVAETVAVRSARRRPGGAGPVRGILDRWRPWLVLAVVLILIAYGPSVARLVLTTPFDAPGLRVW